MNAQIEHLLQQLDEYELPAQFAVSTTSAAATATNTHQVLQEYHQARDEYLKRKIMHAVVEHTTTTYNSNNDEDNTFGSIAVPSAEDQAALTERRNEILQSLKDKSDIIQQKRLELHAKYSTLVERRDEFKELILSQQDGTIDDDDDDEDYTIDEAQLAELEEKDAELQKRRAELLVQLNKVKQDNISATKKLEQSRAKFDALVNKENQKSGSGSGGIDVEELTRDPAALERLEAKNMELQKEINKAVEATNYINTKREFLEEMSGIGILSVESIHNDEALLLKVQLLYKYDIEITLQCTPPLKKGKFFISAAKFASDNTLISGPRTVSGGNGEDDTADSVEGNTSNSRVQLRIPPLDDLVALVSTLPPGENLRTLLTEAQARIRIVTDRVQELSMLLEEPDVVVKIGPYYQGISMDSSSNNETKNASQPPHHYYQQHAHDQMIHCSWNKTLLVAVLRLYPDCPLVDGSVCIDELLGISGWDTSILQKIQTKINAVAASTIRSPVALIHAIQDEVQRLQDEEGLQLPPTPPKLPVRGGGATAAENSSANAAARDDGGDGNTNNDAW